VAAWEIAVFAGRISRTEIADPLTRTEMMDLSTRGPFELDGLYVVTGGTRGIGRAVSIQFARAGARVIAGYLRDETAALDLQAAAKQQELPVEVCRADLASAQGLACLVEAAQTAGGPLSGLVHCAATGTHRTIESLTGRHLDWTFAVNVRAFLELVTSLLPHFRRPASLLAVSSMGAIRALPKYAGIGASKGALEALVRHLAIELGPRGIRANALSPGAINTGAWSAIPEAEERLADAARRSPLGRLSTTDEIALCAQFLCSSAASAVNGQTLIIDGGTSIVG
jgi:enoyl-[acyl-carrier protein] reductase III